MNKLLIILTVSILGLNIFAQESKQTAAADIVFVEMRLGAILGGIADGKYVNAKTASSSLKKGSTLTLVGPNVGINEGEMNVSSIGAPDEICPNYYPVKTSEKASSGVAFSGNASWNLAPRVAKKIEVNSKAYKRIVRKYLISKGIKRPTIKIKNAYRIDLDGDGKDEVIIHGEKFKRFGASTAKGDYSFIIVRKIVGKRVKTIELVGEYYKKNVGFAAPNRHEISSILDLNGDGKMEVVLFGQYYEGSWSVAYEIKKSKAKKVLENGCGV